MKTQQLQIRVSSAQKKRIKSRAEAAGLDVSAWVLEQLLPVQAARFEDLVRDLARCEGSSGALAAMHDFLVDLSRDEFRAAVAERPRSKLTVLHFTYLAAMIEHRAAQLDAPTPAWVRDTEPLAEPYFASSLKGLRLHLLTHSPPAFRRRNLFVDSAVGDRV